MDLYINYVLLAPILRMILIIYLSFTIFIKYTNDGFKIRVHIYCSGNYYFLNELFSLYK